MSVTKQALEVQKLVAEGLKSREVLPLPFTVFQAHDVEAAFQHLIPGKTRSSS